MTLVGIQCDQSSRDMNDFRKQILQDIENSDKELFEKIKHVSNPKPEELWQLSQKRFIEWRKRHDLPKLLKHFDEKLLLFKEWKHDNKLSDKHILNTGKITPFLEHKKLSKKKKLFIIEQTLEDRISTFVCFEKLEGTKHEIGKEYRFKVLKEFISYLDWLKERNKTEKILKINLRHAPNHKSEKVFIQSNFELLKMGGIHVPVSGFGILLKGKYLEFVNLCGLKLTGEISYGEFGSLDISFSACDNWQADNLKMTLLDFEHCSIENLRMTNSKIQQWSFYNCEIGGDIKDTQLSQITIFGGLFKPVIKDCTLFYCDIQKDRCLTDNNLYGYQVLKKIYADQGDDKKAIEYFMKENEFIRQQSRGFKFFTRSISKLYWGYGRRPHKIIYYSIVLIFFFALVYYLNSNYISINAGNFKDISIWDSLYFSITAFTTLGFGDLSPSGGLRIITSIEAFIGLLNMGFLIAGYANNKY